MLSYKTKLDLV